MLLRFLTLVISSLLLITTALATIEPAQTVNDPNTLTQEELSAGWINLFDGKTPTGWRGYQQSGFPDVGWAIEDGWLRVVKNGGGRDLITVDQYDDFIFEMEWKAGKNANSGIMYLVHEDDAESYFSGPEYQLLDSDNLTSTATGSTGGLYALYSPQNKKMNPTGHINHSRIVHCGGHIEHWLNGVRVLTAKIGTLDWNRRVTNSKFDEWKAFGTVKKGHLCLQNYVESDFWFRSMKIREIPANERWRFKAKSELLFNGRNLEGWDSFLVNDAKTADVWSVQDGILICTGTPNGYIYTKKSYQDFVLELDWRWDPITKQEGNSGVLFRQNGEHKIWPRSIEAQLMSKNAGDFWRFGNYPMTTNAERTKGQNTKKLELAEHPVGEWNHYEIHCIGGDVTLIINGKVVNQATDCLQVPGPICLQSEGAPIQFRDIRIHPVNP